MDQGNGREDFSTSNTLKEFRKLMKGIWYLIKYEMRKLAPHKKLLTLEEYKQLKKIENL